MNRYVADTHALFWYLTGSARLGQKAKTAFEEGSRGEAVIFIPVIVLSELYYLNEKIGRPLVFSDAFADIKQSGQFALIPFMPDDVLDFEADASVPEMHDRMIAGVARRFNATCITMDGQLRLKEGISTIW